MKILYVEDNLEDAGLTQLELGKHAPHINLDTVTTLTEALARLENSGAANYDLVLADLRLPDGDAVELLNYIRRHALPLAVVIITGYGSEETAVNVLKAGADDYITKHQDYLPRLPLILEDALGRFRARVAQRASPLRVLYAERHPVDVDLARHHLARHAPHIHLESVSTGPEALHRLTRKDSEGEYNLLLLDFRLPGMSGLELLKALKETSGSNIPVILISGQGDEEIAAQALKLGAADYIVKSAGYLHRLPSVIENAVHHHQLAQKQKALRKSQATTRALLNAIPDLIFRINKDGVNLEAISAEGMPTLAPPDELIGKGQEEFLPPEMVKERMHYINQALQTGRLQHYEYEILLHGELRYEEARIVPMADDEVMLIIRDITERVRAAEAIQAYSEQLEEMVAERTKELQTAHKQLIRREKMATLGQLAAAVAHELRNPLGGIRSAAYFLNMAIESSNPEIKETLQILEKEIGASEYIIRSLLEFAQLPPPARHRIEINPLLNEAVLQADVPENIDVVWKLDNTLPHISADRAQLRRVFDNIITNAIQAMCPPYGRDQSGQLVVTSTMLDSDRLAVSFADTGAGIAPENLDRLFEPLFTTKAKGIGFGLAFAKNIVDAHNGEIQVESEPGRGSTFTVKLPI